MHPEFEDEEGVNPFDLWEGANFRLRIRKVEGYRNYDKSSFDSPSALNDDDAELEAIWNREYPLQELLDPKNFKSYEELQQKLNRVLGGAVNNSNAAEYDEDDEPAWTPPVKEEAPVQEAPMKEVASTNFDDDDDSLEFFKNLANS